MPLPPHTYRKEIKDAPIRVVIPERDEDKKFHIFQASENTRMLHALQNWNWFERDKPKLLQYLAEVTQRPIAMLRMDSGWKHRLKMENIEALESVISNETRFRSSADYWKKSLRNNWGKTEMLRDGYFHWRHGDNKIGLMRIGDPNRGTIPAIIFFKDSSQRDRRRSRWGDFEWFIQELEDSLAKAQFFYPLFWCLKIKGIPRRAPAWWPYGEEDHNESEEETMMEEAAETIDYIDKHIDWHEKPKKPIGPAASFSRRDLLFCVKPGEIDERTVTVKNKGSVALFYSWERRPVEPLVLPGRKKEAGERVFKLMCGTGSLLPGQSRKFYFKFYSNQIGTHMEIWLCRVYPKPTVAVKPVRLKGVTLFDDRKIGRWQTRLERILDYREMMRGIGEALHDIMETAAQASRPTAELRDRQYISSSAAFNFIRKNLKMNPPLFFTPSNFIKLEKLAQTLMPDGIVPGTPSPPAAESEMDASVSVTASPVVIQPQTDATAKEARKDRKGTKKGKGLGEEMALTVSPSEEESRASAKEGKEEKKKIKKSKSMSEEDNLASASPPETDAATPGLDVSNHDHHPITREDMFCKPCFDTYTATQPPPPALPPPAAWAGSVSSILLAIKACPDRKRRRTLKLEIRDLLETAAIPPHQTSLLLMAMYRTLDQVSGDFEKVMETVTEESGHPVVEQLLRTYYDQIEAEQAASEAAERLRDGKGTDDMDWPFEEDDTESAILGGEIKKEARRQQAHEMLHYLMRWVHVLTEAKCILKYGIHGFQEQIDKDQAVVALLIDEKLHDLSLLGMDDDACWQAFDLQRKKQVLDEEFAVLPKCQLPICPDCPSPLE